VNVTFVLVFRLCVAEQTAGNQDVLLGSGVPEDEFILMTAAQARAQSPGMMIPSRRL
jgi:hypothetical protein